MNARFKGRPLNIVIPQTGIDVAKDELVVSINQGKPFVVVNSTDGCRELVGLLPKVGVVHIEASGGYERLVQRTLCQAGIKVVLHNPLKPRRLAQALGVRAKTDPVDAKTLSRTGALLPEGSVKSLDRQQLADHSRAIEALRDHLGEYKRRSKIPELDPVARQLFVECILDLEQRIAAAERLFDMRVRQSECAEAYKLIQSIPALGKTTARICVCELPEDIYERTPDQIASYAGLAPVDDSSGKRTGQARLGHGNARLKRAFYMPAICAIRSQKWARELYARLRAKGRCHQASTVAVMRRLLVRAVAVLKRGSPWQVEPIKA
jgi:transposase